MLPQFQEIIPHFLRIFWNCSFSAWDPEPLLCTIAHLSSLNGDWLHEQLLTDPKLPQGHLWWTTNPTWTQNYHELYNQKQLAATQKSVFASQHLNIFLDFRDRKALCVLFTTYPSQTFKEKSKVNIVSDSPFCSTVQKSSPSCRTFSLVPAPTPLFKFEAASKYIWADPPTAVLDSEEEERRKEKFLAQAIMKRDVLAVVLYCVSKVNLLIPWLSVPLHPGRSTWLTPSVIPVLGERN